MKRRTHSSTFKAKVAAAALRNDKTLAELAAEYSLSPMQIVKWKKQALEGLSTLFEDGRRKKFEDNMEEEKKKLYEEIGRLKMQLDWVKKKCGLNDN